MMLQGREAVDNVLEFNKLGVAFTSKPIIVGGLAMQYYGLRERGSDIDAIITDADYQTLAVKYPNNRKDSWGDLGVTVHGYEMFRSIWKFDYGYFSVGSSEYGDYRVISFEKLFLMKVLAVDADAKHKRDVGLILDRFKEGQNAEYRRNMDENVSKYLSVPGGIIYNGEA